MRIRPIVWPATLAAGAMLAAPAAGQWVTFENQTASRLLSDPSLGATDNQEKDYSWGDLNNNGWIDLVVMRKQPFTSSGRRVNVLFMNENGVLVDRTENFAVLSTVAGDQGFLTPTNDRDSEIVDLDNDGWRDVATATTLSDGQPKHISHPRIYMNLGELRGQWLGLRYENHRYPQLEGIAPNGQPHAPRFCSIAAGDLTENGYADLYFGDYDSGGGQTLDFNNRLLINAGDANPAYFSDETQSRFPTSSYWNSAFGAASEIADMNGNGFNDIVKQTALNPPQHIAIKYNDPANPGSFIHYQTLSPVGAPYFVSVGDLNNNGMLDVVVTDDGTDRYYINQGNNQQGFATFVSFTLPESPVGFGSNSVIADLNNNGWNDIIIADVDVDISGCSRTTNIYRNNRNGPNVTFTRDLANIPANMLQGVFDVAVFDLTGNGWLDLIMGRCNSTQVWVNTPPVSLTFAYPKGRPDMVDPGEDASLTIELDASGGSITNASLFTAVNGGPFNSAPLGKNGNDQYIGTLPATDCGNSIRYYVEVVMDGATIFRDPPAAPADFYSALAAEGTVTTHENDMDGDVSGWTVWSDPSLTAGAWEQVIPLGVISGGNLVSPDGDASANPNGMAFLTQNCSPGQPAGQCNVNGGPTILTSPVIDLEGGNAVISYDRWFFCSTASNPSTADFLITQVSNNGGGTWVTVHQTGGTGSQWETASFFVSDYVTPSANVMVRFVVDDSPNNSITNAAIDNFKVEECVCGESCTGDLNNSGAVDVQDLLILLSAWGPCKGDCPADLNNSGAVDVQDLLILLSNWGPCP